MQDLGIVLGNEIVADLIACPFVTNASIHLIAPVHLIPDLLEIRLLFPDVVLQSEIRN